MTTNLFINYYQDKNEARQAELDHCVLENMKVFDNIIVIANDIDFDSFDKMTNYSGKTIPVICFHRPTFTDYFELTKCAGEQNLNVISNLDIIIPIETLIKAKEYFKSDILTCLALTRWDIKANGEIEFFHREYSQDCWMFKGEVRGMPELNYGLGKPGSDNAIAYELSQAGYTILNPSLSLRTLHHHVTRIRNYIDSKGMQEAPVPPPYKHLIPTEQ